MFARNDSTTPDMGKVYDDFAEAFRQSDQLPTWKYVGKPAMEKLLGPWLRPGVTFLDLGSASARVEAGLLIPHGVRPEDITGVEISPEQVEMARTRIPQATFVVGNIADPLLLLDNPASFDVVFSHMVFEHLSDEQLAQTCANAYRLLKDGGVFAFVVTHPIKMTDVNGDLVTTYGEFETTAPWGGVLHNWRRSVEQTVETLKQAGFKVEVTEDVPFPKTAPAGLSNDDLTAFNAAHEKYSRYSAIRLAVRAIRPEQ
ncbi:MAG: class I SAM-dependent methyltransferase [Candidatus Pacebacteria bacterium]|nr:class I SAM-dependent methyltransferase [Candidatus Paceibacterota bacterium]